VATAPFQQLGFVGRQREVEEVLAALAGPGVVLVSGVAGMGKSRLLAEVNARQPGPAIAARAFLPERDEAWALARSLLREAPSLDPDAMAAVPARAAAALADVVPELAELHPGDVGPLDPESRRAFALEGSVRLLGAMAARGVVLLVDDLQWADPTSLRLIGLLIRRVPQLGFVLAYRPEDVAPESAVDLFLREVPDLGTACLAVPLGPLGLDALRELLGDDSVIAAIAEDTDGTPLAVTEVLRALIARGIVEPDSAGRWRPRVSGAETVAREVARSGQRRAIQVRAAREASRRREVLSLLALLGRETPARVLAVAAGVEEASLLHDLEALARSGLVRLGEAGWAAAHDVIGEAVAEGLDRPERGRLHQTLARALAIEGGDPAEVARHLDAAGDRPAAAAAFAEAARQRLDRFAGEEARALADAGLAIDPAPEIRAALLETRADGRDLRGDRDGARADLREALATKLPASDRSRLLSRLALITSSQKPAEASALVEAALTEAGPDPRARAEALAVAAFVDGNSDQLDRAEARADEARTLFEALGDIRGVASTLDAHANVLFFRGQVEGAASAYEGVTRLYRDSGQLLKVGTPRVMRGLCLVFWGRAQEALSDAEEVLELERTLGQTEGEAGGLWLRSEALFALGRMDEARQNATTALAMHRAVGDREGSAFALATLGMVAQAAGDLDAAEEALSASMAADLPVQAAWAGSRLASVLMARGDLEAAETHATSALAGIGMGVHEARLVLAEIALARGDPGAEARAAGALARANAAGYLTSPARARLEKSVSVIPPHDDRVQVFSRQRKVFMFTDIVSSSNLVEVLGDEAWNHLLRWHDQTLRELFATHAGEEINRMGDGFFVAFDRPEAAVDCAIAIQRALVRHRAEHGFAPQVRIGVHQAEATRHGGDYQGRGVHEAARIGALAAGGEIVASRTSLGGVDRLLLSAARSVSLKGFSQPVQVVSVDWG
jgi:class 3 adenylate cyclase